LAEVTNTRDAHCVSGKQDPLEDYASAAGRIRCRITAGHVDESQLAAGSGSVNAGRGVPADGQGVGRQQFRRRDDAFLLDRNTPHCRPVTIVCNWTRRFEIILR